SPVSIANNAGRVWIEASSLRSNNLGAPGAPHAVVVDHSSSVVFAGCTLLGSTASLPSSAGDGLRSVASDVVLYDTVCKGGPGALGAGGAGGGFGGSAARVIDGSLFASGSSFLGGNGGPCGKNSFGVCGNGGSGGDGLRLEGASPSVSLLAPTLAGGSGGTAFAPCVAGSSGQASVVLAGASATIAGNAGSFSAESPIRGGHSSTFAFSSAPGDAAFVLLALGQGDVPIPALSGVLLLDAPFLAFPIGVADASGALEASVPIPSPPPAMEGATVYLQSLFVQAGGSVLLGAGSSLVLLSPSVP
ncbi:MAG TPA: hypothetical protein VKE69_00050, partial [Planctomycetota bacterium]|nr:hypothetical protein [Planctomycetota bacterium]